MPLSWAFASGSSGRLCPLRPIVGMKVGMIFETIFEGRPYEQPLLQRSPSGGSDSRVKHRAKPISYFSCDWNQGKSFCCTNTLARAVSNLVSSIH